MPGPIHIDIQDVQQEVKVKTTLDSMNSQITALADRKFEELIELGFDFTDRCRSMKFHLRKLAREASTIAINSIGERNIANSEFDEDAATRRGS